MTKFRTLLGVAGVAVGSLTAGTILSAGPAGAQEAPAVDASVDGPLVDLVTSLITVDTNVDAAGVAGAQVKAHPDSSIHAILFF